MARGSKSKKNGSKRRFKKGAISRNAAKQSRGAMFGHLNLPKGVGIFREEPKTRVKLDFLPYEVTDSKHPDRDDEYGIAVPGSLWYKRPYYLHRNIGPNNEFVVCPTSAGQKCPICEHRAKLLKEGTPWDDDSVKALKASMRNLYIVVPLGMKHYPETPHIWDISQFLFQNKLNEEIQENEDYETFPDLEDGYTLQIRFSEESLGSNKFADVSRIDFVDRKKGYDDSILDEVPSLDEILIVPTYEQVSAMFFGGADADELDEDEDEEDEEEEKPRRSSRGTARRPSRKEEDEDEADEDDDEEADEDEEEEKPKRTRRTRRQSRREEEDDEEEDESDEEEDEEKPARRRSGQKQKSSSGKGKGKCPNGHKFGKDCDEYDDCDECDEWEKCLDAQEE